MRADRTPGSGTGSRPRSGRWLVRGGLALLSLGLMAGLVGAGTLGYSAWQEHQLTQRWRAAMAQAGRPQVSERGHSTPPSSSVAPLSNNSAPSTAAAGTKARGGRSGSPELGALFAIKVPKIGYYAAVRQGVSLSVLFVGPGHYPGTALPGQSGNVGVAAHNTYWIQFGNLRAGDQVTLQTLHESYTYRITGTQIVSPDNRTVLAQRGGHYLTLTTCWPLWAGALARQRLVISAVLARPV